MLRTLPVFLLVVLSHCQSTDDVIAILAQNGPVQRVASNQAPENPQSGNLIVASIQTGTGNTGGVQCMMPNGQLGECVPYSNCRDYVINTQNNGNGVIDLAYTNRACPSTLDTCCRLADIQVISSDRPMEPPQQERVGCGWANPDGVGFLTEGNSNKNTKFGEFPWMVAIMKVEPLNYNETSGMRQLNYIGGGSLIHPSVVLTVAHYVVGTKTLKARAGEWNTKSITELYPYQDRDIASVEIHKDFLEKNLFYNVAVLFLDRPMDLAPNVGVVCLPPARIPQIENTRCIATGWGKDKFNDGGRYQVILKKIELPVVAHGNCQASLRRTRLGKHFELHSSFMCAGGELGKDTCTGDGGAPLSCPIEYEKDRYVQSGIVAWGIGCGDDGTPGVYADVSVVRDWIDDKVAGKGYDPRTYSY